ncbi:glycoside hydrolase family 3 N-terminal domain-containing protein [Leucobacter sp. W1153]|uniref:glycoside hydrolase family 3 N-terminal domain-containing protein n=1 Tax=Leucobacter sp. W1153 TaxID=3439064 RepID=UPI003F2B1E9D
MRLARIAACASTAMLLALTSCATAPGATSAPTVTPAPELTVTPIPPTPEELRRERAVELVEGWSIRERAASVIMATAPTTDPAVAAAFVQQFGLGGFIVMSPNVSGDPTQLTELTAALVSDPELPPLIAIDQEGGTVSRLPWDPFPGADTLKGVDPAETAAAFAGRSALLREAGVNVNFGIVADVAPDPQSFIYSRQLGVGFEDAAARVTAAVSGEQEMPGLSSTLKHFPGHGAAPGDSHAGVPTTELSKETWRSTHALPFAAGIEAGARLLMFGHLAYHAVDPTPASLSPTWHAVARDDLGFTGVIVSDDLGMLLDSGLAEYSDLTTVTISALSAGTDLALLVRGSDPTSVAAVIDGIVAAVDTGTLAPERLYDAAIRVAMLRLELAS